MRRTAAGAAESSMHALRRARFALFILLVALIAAILGSFCLGRYAISLPTLLGLIRDGVLGRTPQADPTAVTVFYSVRLPRILAAALIGAALAAAGAAYQGLFRNPMVSPDLLGASSGAGFGAAVGLMLSLNLLWVSVLAFVLGVCAVLLAYGVSAVIGRGGNAVLVLILTGMVVSSLFSAFTSIIKYVADPDDKLPAITFWLMGGLSNITMDNLLMLLPPMAVGFVPLLLLRWRLNVLSCGEEEAQALGLNTRRLRAVFIFCATVLTSSSVAVNGVIGWVGLLIPHVARIFVGPNYRYLLPASLLTGATFLILADDIARSAFAAEIPLGILTSVIGAPFFILLLLRERKRGT